MQSSVEAACAGRQNAWGWSETKDRGSGNMAGECQTLLNQARENTACATIRRFCVLCYSTPAEHGCQFVTSHGLRERYCNFFHAGHKYTVWTSFEVVSASVKVKGREENQETGGTRQIRQLVSVLNNVIELALIRDRCSRRCATLAISSRRSLKSRLSRDNRWQPHYQFCLFIAKLGNRTFRSPTMAVPN